MKNIEKENIGGKYLKIAQNFIYNIQDWGKMGSNMKQIYRPDYLIENQIL